MGMQMENKVGKEEKKKFVNAQEKKNIEIILYLVHSKKFVACMFFLAKWACICCLSQTSFCQGKKWCLLRGWARACEYKYCLIL